MEICEIFIGFHRNVQLSSTPMLIQLAKSESVLLLLRSMNLPFCILLEQLELYLEVQISFLSLQSLRKLIAIFPVDKMAVMKHGDVK